MTHKADAKFFDAKRSWSERKDLLLGYYLTPYLPKIATQRRPVLLVDGFAGPGTYGDGSDGSPAIIANAAEKARRDGLNVPVEVLCVEADPALCASLRVKLEDRPHTTVTLGAFQAVLPVLEQKARTHSIFLYLDPFTVTGLVWDDLDRVFRWVQAGSSIEVLLNFSGSAITRIGCALEGGIQTTSADDGEPNLAGSSSAVSSDLDRVLGGTWWKTVVSSNASFPEKVGSITDGYCDQLRRRFAEVCRHDIRERSHHKVPKYTLVFGSRHPDALVLMNDAAVKSRERLAEEESPKELTLFELRSTDLVPDRSELVAMLVDKCASPMPRIALVVAVVRSAFGRFGSTEIRAAISDLIRQGVLASETGKSRINDSVKVRRSGAH